MRHSLVTVVAAHPKRRAAAELLDEAVNAHAIVYDERNDEWDTMSQAWRTALNAATRGRATHILVLQDDAMPIANLIRTTLEAIDQHPDVPISLYLGRKKPAVWATNVDFAVRVAEREGFSWLRASHLLHGVALVLPVDLVRPMLTWCSKSNAPYDERVGYFLRHVAKTPVFYPQPSLVDHDDSMPSLVRHSDDRVAGTAGRVAYRVGAPTWEFPDHLDIVTPIGAPT